MDDGPRDMIDDNDAKRLHIDDLAGKDENEDESAPLLSSNIKYSRRECDLLPLIGIHTEGPPSPTTTSCRSRCWRRLDTP